MLAAARELDEAGRCVVPVKADGSSAPEGRDSLDCDALYCEQQRARARENAAFEMLAASLTEIQCGTGRRAHAIHLLLALETVLSQALGECGRDEYQRVVDRYLAVRHGGAR